MQTRYIGSNLLNDRLKPWLNWAIGVMFVVLVFGFQTGYAVTNRMMAQSLGLTLSQIGLIGSVYTWGFAITQLLSGALLDRVGARRVLPIACAFLTLGIGLFSAADSFTALLFAQLFVALGAAFGFVGAGFIGGVWFGYEKFGVMFAWVQFVASVSAFFFQQIFAYALHLMPWYDVIATMAVVSAGLFAFMLLALRDPDGWGETHHWPRHPIGFAAHVLIDVYQVIQLPSMVKVLLTGAVSFGGMLAVGIVWGPKMVMIHGFSVEEAQHAVSFAWLGLAFGAPSFASLSDRLAKRKNLLLISILVQAVLMIGMIWVGLPSVFGFSLALFLFGFAAGGSMLPFTMGAELAGSQRAGTAAALVNGTQFVIGGVMMALPGKMMSDMVGQEYWALSILPALLLLGLPLFMGLKDTFNLNRHES